MCTFLSLAEGEALFTKDGAAPWAHLDLAFDYDEADPTLAQ